MLPIAQWLGGECESELGSLVIAETKEIERRSSTCEAELGSRVTAATEAVGIQTLMLEAGFGKLPIVISTDNKVAYDPMKKLGPGKLRHVQLRRWYLQDAIRYGIVPLRRVPGEKTLQRHMENVNARKAKKAEK